MIENYNRCFVLASESGSSLEAYLVWGAEYWVLRQHAGDESYMGAFKRIVMSRDKLSACSTGDD